MLDAHTLLSVHLILKLRRLLLVHNHRKNSGLAAQQGNKFKGLTADLRYKVN